MTARYARQQNFYGFGGDAQEKLGCARIAIVGMGALGTVAAEEFAREGVGFLRLIDRDLVELSNLQRQFLYTESDASQSLPKVTAAAQHLAEINREIAIDPVLDDLNAGNGEGYLKDVDLIIDATDNLDTRYLINEISVEYEIPWIYGGVIEAKGMTMVFTPGGPCFVCVSGTDKPLPTPGVPKTCATAGVLNSVTAITASLQVLEATKLIVGSGHVRRGLLRYRLWENDLVSETMERSEECPVCRKKQYQYLGHVPDLVAQPLCGSDAVQITPPRNTGISIDALRSRLDVLGNVMENAFFLDFENEETSFRVFRNGRVIIRNVSNPLRAKAIYNTYIGT